MGKPPLDSETENWRGKYRVAVLKEISVYLERVYRKSQSKESVRSKTTAIMNLCAWKKQLPSEIVKSIKEGDDPYQVLDDFAGYLVKTGQSPFSVKNSVSGARRFLVYSGIKLSSDEFKDRVSLPRVRARTHDIPLTIDILQKAFVYCASPVGKLLIAFLTSTACRVREALPTKYSEIDFSVNPPRIHLPESRTKDRIARYVWLTDETVLLIKEAGLKGDDYLFPTSSRGRWRNHGPMSYWNASTMFYNALKRAGFYKEDDHGRSLITLHSIRKFTYSRLAASIGKEYAQSIVGHSEYLDQSYWRVTLEEMGQKFKDGQLAITIMARAPVITEEQVEEIVRKIMLEGQLEGLPEGPQKEATRKVAMRVIAESREKPTQTGQKLIPAKDVEAAMKAGFRIVGILPDGRAVIEKGTNK